MSDAYGPEVLTIGWPADQPLWRIHRTDHDPLWFGPTRGEPPRGRFDAPNAEYQICYLGGSPAAALVETLLRGRQRRVIARSTLRLRTLTAIHPQRTLPLARLDGPGMVRLGTGGDIIHAADYSASRRLAFEVFQDNAGVDGLRYRSRWDSDCFCVALFNRAEPAVTAAPDGERLDRSPHIQTLLDRYRVGIV